MKTFPAAFDRQRGSAIVITLAILVLVSVLAVGMFNVLMAERTSANGTLEAMRARALNQLAADHAIALIREATKGTPGKIWSSQPGRITVFNFDHTVDTVATKTLASGAVIPGSGDTDIVDLNQVSFNGNYPIASPASVGSTSPVPMNVKWVNVLQDPTAAATATNKIVGRYAFWVDDETAKLNINTADGTVKNGAIDGRVGPASYGPGTPTEVSLEALKKADSDGNLTPIDVTVASAIAKRTGMCSGSSTSVTPQISFNDPSDIVQVPEVAALTGNASSLYADNNFSITTYNRSPELNIFGEPKINLMVAAVETANTAPLNTLALNAMVGAYAYDGLASFPNPNLDRLGNPIPNGNPLGGQAAASISNIVNGGTIGGPVAPNKAPLIQVYPSTPYPAPGAGNGQLPPFSFDMGGSSYLTSLPQFFSDPGAANYTLPGNASFNPVGARIAGYLAGKNSQKAPITWPAFPGSGSNGFRGKYTDRQIDSIALQISDVMSGTFIDHYRMYKSQQIQNGSYLTAKGQLVVGQSNQPHVNEVAIRITTATGSTPPSAPPGTPPSPDTIRMEIFVQWYIPAEYRGQNDMVSPWAGGAPGQWAYGTGGNTCEWLNWQDAPSFTQEPDGIGAKTLLTGGEGTLGGWWQDNMLRVTDGPPPLSTGTLTIDNHSVLDLFGNDPSKPDPDQVKAAYCQHRTQTTASGTSYLGSGPIAGGYTPITEVHGFIIPSLSSTNSGVRSGYYVCSRNYRSYTSYNMKPGLSGSTVNITGGIAIWTHNESGPGPIDVVPLDSLHGNLNSQGLTILTGVLGPVLSPSLRDGSLTSGTLVYPMRQTVLDAVIPIPPTTVKVPSAPIVIAVGVDDPVVNKFPGDWHPVTPSIPMDATTYPIAYRKGANTDPKGKPPGAQDWQGAPPGFLASNNGDPSGYWWPEQSSKIPKIQRYPSAGYLQYIHTGIMPDKNVENLPLKDQHGTPFRLLNFSPSGDPSQRTDGGADASYPDWAMLDLFTVPAALQPMNPATPLDVSNCPPPIQLTWGGATTGRLNPNSAIFPFTNISRTTPWESIVKNVQISNSYDGFNFPSFSKIYDAQDADPTHDSVALAAAINKYMVDQGRPLMLPGEICNIPEVAAFLYNSNSTFSNGAARSSTSRNDLVRQIVGNLSTQSNTFTVWAVAQTIKKNRTNSQYGIGETTVATKDTISAESRMKFIVERYLDNGADGVTGNANAAGADGILGTPDDSIDRYNPAMSYPLHYKYRILSATQVNN